MTRIEPDLKPSLSSEGTDPGPPGNSSTSLKKKVSREKKYMCYTGPQVLEC